MATECRTDAGIEIIETKTRLNRLSTLINLFSDQIEIAEWE